MTSVKDGYRSQGSLITKEEPVADVSFAIHSEQVTGIKHDQGKLRWDLLPLRPVQLAVEVMTKNLDKYGEDNWQRIDRPIDRFYAALMRHISAWRLGENLDPETKLPHLAHALVCVLFLVWHTERSKQ